MWHEVRLRRRASSRDGARGAAGSADCDAPAFEADVVVPVEVPAAAGVVTLFSPVIVHLLTLGVHDPSELADARRECWVLLFLVLPQIGLYGLIALAIAAQNARGHFTLAAGAPTLAVALHASAQCWGAARVGLPLWPGWGWNDPTVRALSRRLAPAIGTATLD